MSLIELDIEKGFELPSHPPEHEELAEGGIQELLDQAPKWDESKAAELLHLLKSHSTLRSAFMFGLELARPAELNLRNADTIERVKFLQGFILGLTTFVETLQTQMIEAETPNQEAQDVQE